MKPKIKLQGGKVLLKDGKVSCTCCGGPCPCDPDVTTIWLEEVIFVGEAMVVTVSPLPGSLCSDPASFGTELGGTIVRWIVDGWYVSLDGFSSPISILRCDPQGVYIDGANSWTYSFLEPGI